jgi:hypothetical protein
VFSTLAHQSRSFSAMLAIWARSSTRGCTQWTLCAARGREMERGLLRACTRMGYGAGQARALY